MARKTTKSAALTGSIIVIIGVLALSALMYIVFRAGAIVAAPSSAQQDVYVSMGGTDYDFSSGKAVKRTDADTLALKAFLTQDAQKSVSDNCRPVYNNVVAINDQKDQVRLSYGCPYPNATMFAVKKDGQWQTISPTNQFDLYGIPLCSYVDKYQISNELAPICFRSVMTDSQEKNVYSVR